MDNISILIFGCGSPMPRKLEGEPSMWGMDVCLSRVARAEGPVA